MSGPLPFTGLAMAPMAVIGGILTAFGAVSRKLLRNGAVGA